MTLKGGAGGGRNDLSSKDGARDIQPSRRPGGRRVICVVFRDPLDIGAVGVHDINVEFPLAVRAENDLSARRRPRRVLVAPRPTGQDAEIASVGVYGSDLEETFDLGGEYDL